MEDDKVKIHNLSVIKKYILQGRTVIIFIKVLNEVKAVKSEITDVNENFIQINFPFNSALKFLKKDEFVRLRLFPEDGYYVEFNSQLVEFKETLGSFLLKLKFPLSVVKYQRRDAYRVKVALNGGLIEIKDSNMVQTTPPVGYSIGDQVAILNLSLGGAMIASNKFYNKNANCYLIFNIPTFDNKLNLEGIIVRSRKIEALKSKYLFHFGIMFNQIKEVPVNQSLSKYLTQMQLSRISKKQV